MVKWISSLLLSLLCLLGSAQDEKKIFLGTIDSIYSRILNESRKIWVHVPKSDSPGLYAIKKYPVIYLLDGDSHFQSVVAMTEELSMTGDNGIMPQMIVVGIPNTDRTRDLTPTAVHRDIMMDSNSLKNSGGEEQFLAFIQKELMPYIESTYPALPYKTLIGHSFGGLAVIHTLINHKELFNAYIAIDPSMWWDKSSLLHQAETVLAKDNYHNKSLYLGIANTMAPGMDTTKVKKDKSTFTNHIRSILALDSLLQLDKGLNGMSYDYKYYPDENHGSVPLIATYDALHFIFSFFEYKSQPAEYMSVSMNNISKLETHYKQIAEHYGFPYPIPQMTVSQMGYRAMGQKKMQEAEYLFKMNAANYPTSLKVYESLGDLYTALGNKEKAIDNYKKALSFKEIDYLRDKLNVLIKK